MNGQLTAGHILVSGTIAAGKTTVATGLASALGVSAWIEEPDDNPFLRSYYSDPQTWAFRSQAWFTAKAIGQHAAIARVGVGVQDHSSMEAVGVFAATQLSRREVSGDEFKLLSYSLEVAQLYLPPPSLVVYLQAPISVLRQRIATRGRSYEVRVDDDFLAELDGRRRRMFDAWSASPVIEVDTVLRDLRDESEIGKLADQVRTMLVGGQ